jgi:hypothetical protein
MRAAKSGKTVSTVNSATSIRIRIGITPYGGK